MHIYIFRIFMSQPNLWHCISSHPSNDMTEMSPFWSQRTDDGRYLSMWNTLYKPVRSDCDMTRFRAYQAFIYNLDT